MNFGHEAKRAMGQIGGQAGLVVGRCESAPSTLVCPTSDPESPERHRRHTKSAARLLQPGLSDPPLHREELGEWGGTVGVIVALRR